MVESIIEGVKQGFISFLKWIGVTLINSSYWICLFVCIGALILYLAGLKKAGKWMPISFVVYYVLQAVKLII